MTPEERDAAQMELLRLFLARLIRPDLRGIRGDRPDVPDEEGSRRDPARVEADD